MLCLKIVFKKKCVIKWWCFVLFSDTITKYTCTCILCSRYPASLSGWQSTTLLQVLCNTLMGKCVQSLICDVLYKQTDWNTSNVQTMSSSWSSVEDFLFIFYSLQDWLSCILCWINMVVLDSWVESFNRLSEGGLLD